MANQLHQAHHSYLVEEMALARKVALGDISTWLQKGWEDTKALKGVSLLYSALFIFIGYFISLGFYQMDLPYLILPALSGFLLVGPAIAVGFYEGSMRRQNGEGFSLFSAIFAFKRNSYPILGMGLAQVFLFMVWIRLSFTLFAIAFPGVMPEWGPIFERAASLQGLHFAVMIMGLGAVFATLIFFSGAFSLPMMMERKTVLIPAMLTSAYAVAINFKVMVVWAIVIAGLMFAALLSVVGLLVVFPLIGHATWHAYKQVMAEA